MYRPLCFYHLRPKETSTPAFELVCSCVSPHCNTWHSFVGFVQAHVYRCMCKGAAVKVEWFQFSVASFPTRIMVLMPITLGNKTLPALRQTRRSLWRKHPVFFVCRGGKKLFLLLHKAVFALQTWQTDTETDSLKWEGFNPQVFHLWIFTEHHKMLLVGGSRIPLSPSPA